MCSETWKPSSATLPLGIYPFRIYQFLLLLTEGCAKSTARPGNYRQGSDRPPPSIMLFIPLAAVDGLKECGARRRRGFSESPAFAKAEAKGRFNAQRRESGRPKHWFSFLPPAFCLCSRNRARDALTPIAGRPRYAPPAAGKGRRAAGKGSPRRL